MANMSYCRFQNTVGGLHDCVENMADDDLSLEEQVARRLLINLCMQIADNYRYEVEDG